MLDFASDFLIELLNIFFNPVTNNPFVFALGVILLGIITIKVLSYLLNLHG